MKAYPYIRVTLQDLPHVLQQAETVGVQMITLVPHIHVPFRLKTWRKECPEAVENNRVSFKPIDFLQEAPVQDQDIYYVTLLVAE